MWMKMHCLRDKMLEWLQTRILILIFWFEILTKAQLCGQGFVVVNLQNQKTWHEKMKIISVVDIF